MGLDVQEQLAKGTGKVGLKVSELTLDLILKAMRLYLKWRSTERPGVTTLNEMVKSGQKLSTVDIRGADIDGFLRCAKQYGVRCAISRDETNGGYVVFFSASRAEQLDAAIKAYARHKLAREQDNRESIVDRLQRQGVRSKEFQQAFPSLAAPPETARLPERAGSQPGRARSARQRPARGVER